MFDVADLPDYIAALKALLIAAKEREAETVAHIARKDERIERLEKLGECEEFRVRVFQAAVGCSSQSAFPLRRGRNQTPVSGL